MTREDIDLIIRWFAHIEQMATDRKTANGFETRPQEILDEIRCKTKECKEYVQMFNNETDTPEGLSEATKNYVEAHTAQVESYEAFAEKEDVARAFKAGAEWRETQLPKLPKELDKAAFEYNKRACDEYFNSIPSFLLEGVEAAGPSVKEAFIAGAEWAFGQGETHETTICEDLDPHGTDYGLRKIVVNTELYRVAGDKVIVQVRKK